MNFATVSRSLGFMTLLALLGAGVLLVMLILPRGRRWLRRELGEVRGILGLAAFVAAVASAGSLYLSESVGFTPCLLCWYQRIAMYPLVFVLGVGTLRGDRGASFYALPIAVTGLLISIYHIVIQFQPALDAGACSPDVPCTLRYLAIFGFISIPWMAGAAFLLIIALLLVIVRSPEAELPDG